MQCPRMWITWSALMWGIRTIMRADPIATVCACICRMKTGAWCVGMHHTRFMTALIGVRNWEEDMEAKKQRPGFRGGYRGGRGGRSWRGKYWEDCMGSCSSLNTRMNECNVSKDENARSWTQGWLTKDDTMAAKDAGSCREEYWDAIIIADVWSQKSAGFCMWPWWLQAQTGYGCWQGAFGWSGSGLTD